MRTGRFLGSCLGLLLLALLTACQGVGFSGAAGPATPTAAATASPAPAANLNEMAISAAESAAVANGRDMVWGAVSNCTCHEYVGTSSVAAAVDNAKIDANVQELTETASDIFFYVTYDPRVTTKDRVVAAIKKGGGRVKAGPPTSLTE